MAQVLATLASFSTSAPGRDGAGVTAGITEADKTMNALSLYTGAGGMDLGFHAAGFTTIAGVEIERTAAGVFAFHHPHIPIYADIKKFSPRELGLKPDVVHGGSPCQDLSLAGGRAGLAGGKSGLFHEIVRVIDECRPRTFLWENVVGALSTNSGRDFAVVLGSFSGWRSAVPVGGWPKAGVMRGLQGRYHIAWRTLNARYFGVAQSRSRVFVVGSLGDGRCAEILFERESVCGDFEESKEEKEIRQTTGALTSRARAGGGLGMDFELGGGIVATLDANYGKLQGQSGQDLGHGHSHLVATHSITATHDGSEDGTGRGIPLVAFARNAHRTTPSGPRRLTPVECERLMGWPNNYTLHRINLDLDGNRWVNTGKHVQQADAPRYRQCGNGVVAPVAEWIATRIREVA